MCLSNSSCRVLGGGRPCLTPWTRTRPRRSRGRRRSHSRPNIRCFARCRAGPQSIPAAAAAAAAPPPPPPQTTRAPVRSSHRRRPPPRSPSTLYHHSSRDSDPAEAGVGIRGPPPDRLAHLARGRHQTGTAATATIMTILITRAPALGAPGRRRACCRANRAAKIAARRRLRDTPANTTTIATGTTRLSHHPPTTAHQTTLC